MRKKILIINIILIFCILISNVCFAKYKLENISSIDVYIDKTPPEITIFSNGESKKVNPNSETAYTEDIIVYTSDNVAIDYNEYYYNPTEKNFDNTDGKRFDSGKTFSDEGYYKIISVDTTGNKTEIIIIIDKTPPEITVNYYKSGEQPIYTSSVKVTKFVCKPIQCLLENVLNLTEENNDNEVEEKQNITENEIVDKDIENTENIENEIKEEIIVEEKNEIEETKEEVVEEKKETTLKMMLTAGYTAGASNETDFKNALNNGATAIITYASINFSSPIYINHPVTITCGTNENALRYTAYDNFIIVQNGGALTLNGMVVDCRQFAGNHGINCINVQAGGSLTFGASTIIDGGLSNTGVLINSGATVTYNSGQIAYTGKGINCTGTGKLIFNNLNDGRNNEFWNNTTAISFEGFSGTCDISHSNFKIRNGTDGIIFEYGSGTINMSNGSIYSNSDMGIIVKEGTLNMTGGNIYSNTNYGIDIRNGTVNLKGGSIYSNGSGVLLKTGYNGKLTTTGGSISGNSTYAIKHNQLYDGNCNIYGGTISGAVYLGQTDNYVNTNTNYPTFTVTPSNYYFKRKLVRTYSNDYANNELSRVTMTANGSWYKYVEDEYIKVWLNCNVVVTAKDYYGNVLRKETLNGTLGSSYSVTPYELEDYDLIEIPSNATGVFTNNTINVEFKYDLKNVAVVNYFDNISEIKSAKYWYNPNANVFEGEGSELSNYKLFKDYGYYKVVVTNVNNLTKEYKFTLNKNSIVR